MHALLSVFTAPFTPCLSSGITALQCAVVSLDDPLDVCTVLLRAGADPHAALWDCVSNGWVVVSFYFFLCCRHNALTHSLAVHSHTELVRRCIDFAHADIGKGSLAVCDVRFLLFFLAYHFACCSARRC